MDEKIKSFVKLFIRKKTAHLVTVHRGEIVTVITDAELDAMLNQFLEDAKKEQIV